MHTPSLFTPSRLLLLCLVALLSALHLGCGKPGTGQLDGNLQVTGCDPLNASAAWSLDVRYLTMLYQGTSTEPAVAELRMQTYPGSTTHDNRAAQDLLMLEIHKPLQVQTNQSIPIVKFTPSLSAQTPSNNPNEVSARAVLVLGKTCPNNTQPFLLEGTLTFTKFPQKHGENVEGSFNLTLTTSRSSSPNNQGTLTGSFNFPWQPPIELGHDWVGYYPPTGNARP
ncbi:MAG: hypothetical protein EP343_31585 [Deltaproteobacteria bacterium]|nr:MAG: hypothetical protein EP343_31585 [Deltaproteobacteria bacterium]